MRAPRPGSARRVLEAQLGSGTETEVRRHLRHARPAAAQPLFLPTLAGEWGQQHVPHCLPHATQAGLHLRLAALEEAFQELPLGDPLQASLDELTAMSRASSTKGRLAPGRRGRCTSSSSRMCRAPSRRFRAGLTSPSHCHRCGACHRTDNAASCGALQQPSLLALTCRCGLFVPGRSLSSPDRQLSAAAFAVCLASQATTFFSVA